MKKNTAAHMGAHYPGDPCLDLILAMLVLTIKDAVIATV
jgi:hypothetical protein